MESLPGGNSRLELSWWMVATGILIFLLPCLAAFCYEPAGVAMPCPMNELAGVNCTYIKGIPEHALQVDKNRSWHEFPDEVRDLKVEPFVHKLTDTKCKVFLNISWKLSKYGGSRYKGFILNVTSEIGFVAMINRTYNLAVADWSNEAILETAFRHECIKPRADVMYRVEVHSLPLSAPIAESKNKPMYRRFTNINSVEKSLCSGNSLDPFTSVNWAPLMWENLLQAEDGSVSVEVCFFTAPKVFGFTGYRLALLNLSDAAHQFRGSNQYDNDSVADVGEEFGRACRRFDGVCTGTYKAKLLPVPSDKCYHGKDNMLNCLFVEHKPIVVNSSVCSQTKTTSQLPPGRTSQPQQPLKTAAAKVMHSNAGEDDGHTLDSSKITVLVCGILAAIVLVVVAVVYVYVRRNRYGRKTGGPESPMDSSDDSPPLVRQPVLLVYSTDNESHRRVVRCFAAYLNACCGCDVIYDEWCQVEIAQTSPIEWLAKQMYNAKHVIVVNSLGAHMQHSRWIERKSCYCPTTNLLMPDVFVAAIRQVQNKMFAAKNSRLLHCFHVCFPYTEAKHVLDLSCGRCYRLMDHVEDLILNVHGLSKFSAKGTLSASHINVADYADSKEGRSLRAAIEEAVSFARENPDWFRRYYRSDESSCPADNDHVPVYSRYQLASRPDEESDAFENRQQRDESGTGSIGTASDMEYYPPSVGDDGDGDDCSVGGPGGGGVHGGGGGGASSSDDGIAGMGGRDPTASLPLFAQFSPVCPDDLEDDASSIGSRSFIAKVRELNDQYDSGYYPSIGPLHDRNMSIPPDHC